MLSSLDAYLLKVYSSGRPCMHAHKSYISVLPTFPLANITTTSTHSISSTATSTSPSICKPTNTLLQQPHVMTSSSLGSQLRSSLDPTSIGQVSLKLVTSPTPVSTRAGASTLSLSVSVSVVVTLVAAVLLIAGIIIVFWRLRQRKQKNTGNSTDDVYFTVENQTLQGQ